MELPSALKMKLRILGILPWPNVKGFPIHYVQIAGMYAILFDSVVFTFWFIMWEAETFSEFAQTLICMVVGIFYTMIYSRVIWQRNNFAAIIEDVERRINSSEFGNYERCPLNIEMFGDRNWLFGQLFRHFCIFPQFVSQLFSICITIYNLHCFVICSKNVRYSDY